MTLKIPARFRGSRLTGARGNRDLPAGERAKPAGPAPGLAHLPGRRRILASGCRGEWGTVFPDPRLVAAIVDRVTFNASIIETGTRSYRLATSKTSGTRRPRNDTMDA